MTMHPLAGVSGDIADKGGPIWHPGALRRAFRAVVRFGWWLRRPSLLRRLRRVRVEYVEGVPLVLVPGVHSPVIFRSGRVFARAIVEDARHWPSMRGRRVLDLGTGSGVGAVMSALRGARVIAVDISADAVRCARANAILNAVEDRVDVRQGDLFEVVSGEQFDLVTFNPPFYEGQPRWPGNEAWRANRLFERFAAGLGDVLLPRGYALVLFSTDGDESAFYGALAAYDWCLTPVVVRDFGNEIMTVYRLSRGPRPSAV